MNNKTRNPGFYFVRLSGKSGFTPAEWTGNSWFLTGKLNPIKDQDLDDIIETSIEPPKTGRQPGYFWVRMPSQRNHISAWWDGSVWCLPGSIGKFKDKDFANISGPIKPSAPTFAGYNISDLYAFMHNYTGLISFDMQVKNVPGPYTTRSINETRIYTADIEVIDGKGNSFQGSVKGANENDVVEKILKIVELYR